MKENVKIVFVAVITILLYASSFNLVQAKSSTQFGITWGASLAEIWACDNITSIINNYSIYTGYHSHNWYGAQTVAGNIYSAVSGVGESYSITFYVGHGNIGSGMFPWETQYCISDNNGWDIWDNNIHSNSNQNVRFAFLWSCYQGREIGGVHWPSGNNFGMPNAWLHNVTLSADGYISPDGNGRAFIGFSDLAPILTNDHWAENGAFLADGGYKFLQYFYFAALLYGNTYQVQEALDYAAHGVWGTPSFYESIAYQGFNCTYYDPLTGQLLTGQSSMKVYGDSHMGIHKCLARTMKTRTDGHFYIPNLNVDVMKIESVFSDTRMEGDQIGGTFYSGSTVWPDGQVDIQDQYFIQRKYGLEEGMDGWSYLADIYPDRQIDILDYYLVMKNYGNTDGVYSNDLSTVLVRFNNNQDRSPDENGYVTIPPSASSFTVYKHYGDVAVGAIIIFWQTP